VPELPDVELYLHALDSRIVRHRLERIRLASPFLLRSVSPSVADVEGRRVLALHRLGKRIVWGLEDELFVVIHPMIAGRFRWTPADEGRPAVPGKVGLAAFDFSSGTLIFTEASPKKRASLHLVRGVAALAEHDPGGIDVFSSTLEQFEARLRQENRTLKRALTDPRLFSGVGNAYSDEILHAAQLSPTQLTGNLEPEEVKRLFEQSRRVLDDWTQKLITETGENFPAKVTAFRPDMAVHGKFGKPCPRCGSPVQRISYAANECNYCAVCQTGGKLLADRGLSRLLGKDWPKSLEELEETKRR
jgi:formamidopyrimidine-DNA glycosylase